MDTLFEEVRPTDVSAERNADRRTAYLLAGLVTLLVVVATLAFTLAAYDLVHQVFVFFA